MSRSRWNQKKELKAMERSIARQSGIAIKSSGKTAHWANRRCAKMVARHKKAQLAWGFSNPLSY